MFILKSQKYYNLDNYIEIIGMPASGKSFLIKQMMIGDPKIINMNNQLPSSKFFRQFTKLVYIFKLFLKFPRMFIKDTRIIISTRQKSTKDLYAVLSNWHLIVYMYLTNSENDEVVYAWDQGLFQAIWSIYFTSQIEFDGYDLVKDKKLPNIIYLTDANDEELLKREKLRKKTIRLNYASRDHLSSGRKALEKTIELIEKLGYERSNLDRGGK